MNLSSLLLLFLVSSLVVLFVSWPVMKQWRGDLNNGREVSTLLAERDRILNEINELDFDNTLGKIPSQEYMHQRKDFLLKGTEILKQLDTLTDKAASSKRPGLLTRDPAASLGSQSLPASLSDEDLEIMITNRRAAGKAKTAGFCPKCGKPLLISDVFCGCCGQVVQNRKSERVS